MNNQTLGDSITNKELKSAIDKIFKAEENAVGAAIDLAGTAVSSIPIFSIIIGPIKQGVLAFKEYRELKMLAYYFNQLDELDDHEKADFAVRIKEDEDDELAEKLIYLVSQLNERKKAKILGKITLAFARNKITKVEFNEMFEIVKNLTINDLTIIKYHANIRFSSDISKKTKTFDEMLNELHYRNFKENYGSGRAIPDHVGLVGQNYNIFTNKENEDYDFHTLGIEKKIERLYDSLYLSKFGFKFYYFALLKVKLVG